MKNSYKYKIGEIVAVIYPGQSYPNYRELFESLGFRNKRSNDLGDWGYSDLKQRKWIIFGKETMEKRNLLENVYTIRSLDDDKIELLIAEQGIIGELEVTVKNINKELNEI